MPLCVRADGRATTTDYCRHIAAILEDPALEPAFIALALVLPAESDIAREIGRDIDPDAIFRARTGLRTDDRPAVSHHANHNLRPDGTIGRILPGRQKRRAACLEERRARPACRHRDPDDLARAYRQYQTADNMTDRVAALVTLSLHGVPESEHALADFYKRYDFGRTGRRQMVFAAGDRSRSLNTLDNVRNLTAHPAFSLANPNRVRALIGAFAQGNTTQFNRIDGLGYDFIADTVLALDPKNPQISARLATAFRTWRTLEDGRRRRRKPPLTRIKATPGPFPRSGRHR